jgi:hypothetical protein
MKVDIRPLKEYAVSDLSSRPTLRDTLLIEDDTLDEAEFIAKLDTWLKLFRVDGERPAS